MKKTRVRDGAVLANYFLKDCDDVNHAQLLDGDTRALVSCRDSDAILLYDLETNRKLWIAGGNASTLALIDEDGRAVDALWHGQHNAEWFGDSTVFLFDNAQGAPEPTPSSVKKVAIDAEAGTATLVWSYAFVDAYPGADAYPSGYSEVFGDADRLPSGNVLGVWWPRHLSPSAGLSFDVQLAEVTPAKEVAWSLEFANTGFYAGACVDDPDPGCERIIRTGWKVYSAERFYDAPLVSAASLAKRDDGGAALAFAAHAGCKHSAPTAATWTLADAAGATRARGRFDFAPHFGETRVAVDLPTLADVAGLTLTVADEWDNRRAAALDVRRR